MSNTLKAAIWSTNLSVPVSSMQDWADFVGRKMAEAKKQGASLLLMPEYASEQWMHFAGRALQPTEQIGWMADQVEHALPLLQKLALDHDMALVTGTFPCHFAQGTPPFANRAHVFLPDGTMHIQNKLCLTPKEKNPAGWHLSTGDQLMTFMWQGWKIAVVICLDIELPALSARMAEQHVDAVLVPSMTKKLAGYHRVFDCAKARAVELQAAVCVCGAIANGPGRDPNISGVSVYLPCEEKFGHTGTLALIPPAYAHNVDGHQGDGPMIVAELPLGDIRAMREGGAEVWPGAWKADNLKFCQNT